HCQWAGKIHLSRPAAAWKVAVLRADYDLIRPRRNSRAGVDARAATRLNHNRSGLAENLEVTFANAILARLLRSKLNVELHRVGNAFALAQGVREHTRIHVHIVIFPGRACATIGDLHRHRRIQLADVLSISRVTW